MSWVWKMKPRGIHVRKRCRVWRVTAEEAGPLAVLEDELAQVVDLGELRVERSPSSS